MRSTEFIREAGRNGATDDFGMPVQNAQADAARIAQGQQNLNALKGFFGAKPEELKDAPPGTPIDPYVRARMGYKPATQKEIADFQAANPNYGKVVDREGNPIKSGTPGVTWDAGGEKAVAQTAQAAAPMRKGDVHAGQQGYNTDLERIPGAGIRGQKGYNYQPPAPAPAPNIMPSAPGEPAYVDRIPAVKSVAPAPAPVQSAEPAPSFNIPGAAQAGQGGYNYTTGVPQDRAHANNAGADEITRNDLPFVPYTGPEPKQDVKPVQNPQPVPRRKVPKSVVQVSPDNQNLAGTKTVLDTDELARAKELLALHHSGKQKLGPRDLDWFTKLVANQPAQTRGAQPAAATTGTAAGTMGDYKSRAPAGDSVTVKSGDTLSKIAAANGTTVQAIMAANPNIKDANKIAAGQTVKLRESSEVARIRHLAGLTRN